MKSWDVKIFWKKPTASVVTVQAETQAEALAKINADPNQFLTTLNPTVDAARMDVRETRKEKPAPTERLRGDTSTS